MQTNPTHPHYKDLDFERPPSLVPAHPSIIHGARNVFVFFFFQLRSKVGQHAKSLKSTSIFLRGFSERKGYISEVCVVQERYIHSLSPPLLVYKKQVKAVSLSTESLKEKKKDKGRRDKIPQNTKSATG